MLYATLAFAALNLQSSPPVTYVPAPPPLIRTAPPAPPAPTVTPAPSAARIYVADEIAEPHQPHQFDIHVTGGGETLWRGSLRISQRNQASFSQSKSEAPEAVCGAPYRYGREGRSSINLSLTSVRYAEGEPDYRIDTS